jgi:phenylpropionate dioxygenase-like ring-hydroxylating dioxygenase large terminal subunit
MDRATEVTLIGELQDLAREKQCYLDEHEVSNPVAKYTDPAHFRLEQTRLFRTMPRIVAHGSELEGANSFLRREVAGRPILLTRDADGEVRAFFNVCRHRGARLVDEDRGCRDSFSCPYHAWRYSNRGELLKIPFGEQGFPGVDARELGLVSLPCVERYGWVWIIPGSDAGDLDIDAYLGDLSADLRWLDGESLEIKAESVHERRANWKILIEGGIEAYHFRIVHWKTIGPHFPNNLSSYQRFGDSLRSILPRSGIADVDIDTLPAGAIREEANVLYTLFPLSNLLVMQDHIVWIDNEPLAPDLTRLRFSTLARRDNTDQSHWERNDQIAQATLAEDGEVGEAIQAGIDSGANEVFRFGRFEGALAAFNESVDRHLNMNKM